MHPAAEINEDRRLRSAVHNLATRDEVLSMIDAYIDSDRGELAIKTFEARLAAHLICEMHVVNHDASVAIR